MSAGKPVVAARRAAAPRRREPGRYWRRCPGTRCPKNVGSVSGSTMIGAPSRSDSPLREKTFWATRGEAPARITSAAPGLSWMWLAESASPRVPSPKSMAALAAPVISTSTTETSRALRPGRRCRAASRRRRRSGTREFSVRTTSVGDDRRDRPRTPRPAGGWCASRGTRLTTRTPFSSTRRSRYSPGSTTIELPGAARRERRRRSTPTLDDDRCRSAASGTSTMACRQCERDATRIRQPLRYSA